MATGPALTVLSYGGGQDSSALLSRYIHDRTFRAEYAPNDFLVVMSDTGAEHPDTYEHLTETRERCSKLGIEFHHLTGDLGHHTGHWKDGLWAQWEASSTIGSVAYPKSCSVALKAEPIANFLASWVGRTYGFVDRGKKPLEHFAAAFGKIDLWIGLTRGEKRRCASAPQQSAFAFAETKPKIKRWRERSIRTRYPLIDLGMNRGACQQYLRDRKEHVPAPSLCTACPFKSPTEIAWSARRHPDIFARWVAAEAKKLRDWGNETFRRARQKPENFRPDAEFKNYGVAGRGAFVDGRFVPVTLLDTYAKAEKSLAGVSDAALDAHRMSHGHDVATRF